MQQPELLRSLGDIVARIRDEISGEPATETGAPPQIPGYEIVDRLGEGGMGVVYVARDEVLGRQVAIKVIADVGSLQETAMRRFLREAKAMASIAHPNVVHIYNYGECDAGPYIVMERVQGETLSSRLRRGRLSTDEALDVLEQTIAGLEAAWERGIVHRDVKPSNILLDDNGQVRVCDFGLARPVPTEVGSVHTNLGNVAGTPHYMSPEQARGRATDLRSDIYSLGIVLYEMLTGEVPITLREPAEVLEERIHGEPKTLKADGVSRDLAELFEWMTRSDPDDRPPTYEALRGHVAAVREEGRAPLPDWLRWARNPAGAVVAVMLLLMALSLTLAWWMPAPGTGDDVASGVAAPQFRPTLMVADFTNETGDSELDYLGTALAHAVRRGLIQNLDGFTVAPYDGAGRDAVTSPSAVRPQLAISGMLTGSAEALRVVYRVQDGESIEATDAVGGARATEGTEAVETTDTVGETRAAGGADAAVTTQSVWNAETAGAGARAERGAVAVTEAVTGSENEAMRLQQQLVASVVDNLKERFGEDGDHVALKAPQTEQAHAQYQRGIYYLERAEDVAAADRAIGLLRGATESDPTFAPAHAALGLAYRAKSSITGDSMYLLDAYGACDDAMRLDERLDEAWLCRGWVNADQGNYDRAFEDFVGAIELGGTASAHRALGTLYTELDDGELAEQYFVEALQRDPAYPGAYLSLGWFYGMQNRYAKAIDYYRQAIEYAPDSAYARLSLGAMYYMEGRYDDAVRELTASTEVRVSADALSNLGMALFALGEYDRAVDAFERAIARADNPRYVFYGNLARTHHVAGAAAAARSAFQEAAELARDATRLNDQAAAPRMVLAYYEAALGNSAAAFRQEHEVLAIDTNPNRGEMYFWLALMHMELANHARAVEMLQEAVGEGYPVHEIRASPEFAALADGPVYRDLVSEGR